MWFSAINNAGGGVKTVIMGPTIRIASSKSDSTFRPSSLYYTKSSGAGLVAVRLDSIFYRTGLYSKGTEYTGSGSFTVYRNCTITESALKEGFRTLFHVDSLDELPPYKYTITCLPCIGGGGEMIMDNVSEDVEFWINLSKPGEIATSFDPSAGYMGCCDSYNFTGDDIIYYIKSVSIYKDSS